MSGTFRPVEVPDLGATLARMAQIDAQRQSLDIQRQAAKQEQGFNQGLAELAPALASGQGPEYSSALARMVGLGPRGAAIALPLLQQERDNSAIRDAMRGGAPVAGAPMMRPAAAPGGAVTPATAPAALLPFIEEASRETGIPVPILVAQIRQESNFDPNARGRAGEVGLAQIMPATARNPGFGLPGVDPATLSDPRNNIRFGAQYLAARGRAAGVTDWNDPAQVDRALAAYNGGGDPNYVQNVRRWLPQGGAGGDVTPASVPPSPQQAAGDQDAMPTMAGNPYAAQIQRLIAIGTPRAMQMAAQLAAVGNREAPRMTEVRTNEGVFLVNPQNPSQRIRVGGIPETAPRTPERFEQDRALAEAGAARSQTTVNAGDRETDKRIAAAWDTAEQNVQDAGRRSVLLRRADEAIGRFTPGIMADRRIWLGQVARELGVRSPSTSEGEVLQQVQRQLELAATPRGQGAITENERALIRQAVPILLSTPEGARQAIGLIRQLDDYEGQVARIYRENARRNGGAPNPVSVREEIAAFVAQNQPPDVQAVIDQFTAPQQAGAPTPGVNAVPPPSAQQPVRVQTPEEARRLPPGTPIILPDGRRGVVPGG